MSGELLKILKILGLILTLGVNMSACAGFPGIDSTRWKEEVLLHDGRKIIVDRTVERGGRHEVGQQPPIKNQSLRFDWPGSHESVTWQDLLTEDIGTANFLPMTLDISEGMAYLVVKPMGCLSYNKWDRPNPPYVIFKYQNTAWSRIPLRDLPAGITEPNLIASSPDDVAKASWGRTISSEAIKKFNAGYTQPEYKTILREPLTDGRCPQYSSSPKAPIQTP